jgi:hypothetical protein
MTFSGFRARCIALFSLFAFVVLGTSNVHSIQAQDNAGPNFVRITTGQIASEGGASGASFVDYDADGDLDIYYIGSNFSPNRALWRNDGNDLFTKITTDIITTDTGNMIGVAFADYDNDGDVDAFVAGVPSSLYQNDGSGNFAKVTSGQIFSTGPRGWSPAWADVDRDGDLDLFITHPAGFVAGGVTSNWMFLNDGPPNYTFTRVTGTDPTTGNAPYTVGNFADYDLDGDLDLFVGAGPANGFTAPDFFYHNQLVETGSADLTRITGNILATDRRDGQLANWIDIENDGDLDMYITNWGGQGVGIVNDLYRNDAGTYIKVSGESIVTDRDISLANVWGDFDNDADLDVFVSNQGTNRLYLNNGDGTFTRKISTATAIGGNHWAATVGDYDNNGSLDLFVPPTSPQAPNLLFRNDLQNENSWIKLRLVGTSSDSTAIGAKVILTTTINGEIVTQMREISTQNSFLGHNAIEVHFGLADSNSIESIEIQWPLGNSEQHFFVEANKIYQATEGAELEVVQ